MTENKFNKVSIQSNITKEYELDDILKKFENKANIFMQKNKNESNEIVEKYESNEIIEKYESNEIIEKLKKEHGYFLALTELNFSKIRSVLLLINSVHLTKNMNHINFINKVLKEDIENIDFNTLINHLDEAIEETKKLNKI